MWLKIFQEHNRDCWIIRDGDEQQRTQEQMIVNSQWWKPRRVTGRIDHVRWFVLRICYTSGFIGLQRLYDIDKHLYFLFQIHNMDFHHVPLVNIGVRNLSLSIERPPPILEKLRLRRPQPPEQKDILRNVSLDVPAGSLMAIIGASGSGKVFDLIKLVGLIRLRCWICWLLERRLVAWKWKEALSLMEDHWKI